MRSRVEGSRGLSRYGRLMVNVLIATERITRARGHRGYWHMAKWLGVAAGREGVVVDLGNALLQIHLSDPYWTRLVAPGYQYEHEVERLLASIGDQMAGFVDVGANIGYWSVWVSQRHPRCRVLALEPNPSAYGGLCANNLINGSRFETRAIAVAVDDRRGVPLRVPEGRGGHAGAHLQFESLPGEYAGMVLVDAVPLDEVMSGFEKPGMRILIKLDIEGMEESVLASSTCIGVPEVAVLYEDHGADQECLPTRYLLSRNDQVVFFLQPAGGLVEVSSVEQLAALKDSPKVGYNCISTVRGGPWHQALMPHAECPKHEL